MFKNYAFFMQIYEKNRCIPAVSRHCRSAAGKINIAANQEIYTDFFLI